MILVTGGTGFVGSHLLDTLAARNQPVRSLVRPTRRPRHLPRGVESCPGDLTTGLGLEDALRGVDTVIHVAGVIKALTPAGYFAGNAAATETLVRALRGRPVRLVHVSSLAAIGPSLDGAPVGEDSPPHPVSTYGKSKLEGERVVRALVPDAIIVRPPVVYGPRDAGVFPILKTVARGFQVEIAGGERRFSAIYVQDLVDGLIAAANSARAAGRAYFLAHPQSVSWTEFDATAARIMGRKPRVLRVPIPIARSIGFAGEIWSRITRIPAMISREKVAEACCKSWICDTRRAVAELGFEAPTPLETGLARTLAWYKEAGWLKY